MAYSSSSAAETRLSDEEAFIQALNSSSSQLFAMTFCSIVELGLLEIIAKAGWGLSAAEIATQLPTKKPNAFDMLEWMLYLLTSYSLLKCTIVVANNGIDSQRLYEVAPIGKFFVPNEDGASLAHGYSVIYCKAYMDSWDKLNEAILKGVPFHLTNGVGMFEFVGRDPSFNKEFNIVMTNMSSFIMKNIMELYKGFDSVNQLIDVGGGLGDVLKTITLHYPHIKGINYDLPHVIQLAIPSPGVEFIGGDMFHSVPSGKVIWMKVNSVHGL